MQNTILTMSYPGGHFCGSETIQTPVMG